jgi:hypothetical protein
LHLPDCEKEGDKGCSAYGVEWAKTVGACGRSLARVQMRGGEREGAREGENLAGAYLKLRVCAVCVHMPA